jgi:phosphomannomutase
MSTDPLASARDWHEHDVDTQTREELHALIAAAETGDEAALAEIADAFAGSLQFGTAGLRGKLGPGPNRMNRVVVLRAAAGLARYLQESQGEGSAVVIGYDARRNSDVFARDTAAIMAGVGIEAMVLPRALPTPVLAYAIRHLGADAGVMVTASHNPPDDNGYKVYLGDGSQIVPPADTQISASIAACSQGPAAELPTGDGWLTLGDDVEEAYINRAVSLLPEGPRDCRIVITPMHGVGGIVLERVLVGAGFPQPIRVVEQFDPDPAFPTVAFPNPEEPGAIDLALATAMSAQADIVIANDPDADRCAVAIPSGTSWRMLRGDEVGSLLAWWVVQRLRRSGRPLHGVMAQSIVSGEQLAQIAAGAELDYRQTLTGFKWIGRLPDLVFGYEEALGYCVDAEAVRDKDGITAALLVCELAAFMKAQGRTLQSVLDDLDREFGVYATRQVSVRVSDLAVIPAVMQRLRSAPPRQVAAIEVASFIDLNVGSESLPATDGLLFLLADGSRIIVRPSGTEPKVKCYLQAVVPVQADLIDAREQAEMVLDGIAIDVGAWLT